MARSPGDSDIVLQPIASGEPTDRARPPRRGRALWPSAPTGPARRSVRYDHTTVLWDVAKRKQFGTLRGHRERVLDVAFSPDGEWIATGSRRLHARIWETRTGQNVATLPGPAPGVSGAVVSHG